MSDATLRDTFFSSRWGKYLLRALVLYVFSAIFKSFDLTFISAVQTSFIRSQAFSLLYVVYGLLVWEGAALLAGYAERKLMGSNTVKRLMIILLTLLVYGIAASFGFGFLYAVYDIVFFHRYEAWESFVAVSYNMNFGTFMFYLLLLAFNGIVFYYKGWKEYQVQAERLQRENIQAKYDALRNQIDPHFFFNSLSVLTNLVYKSADLSAEYITQLAKLYRYILDKKFENLVPITTELDFLASYLFLINIRHQQSVRFHIAIDEGVKAKGMIPPASLQMLIENAIKHNRFSLNDPLQVEIKNDNDALLIVNNLRPKAVAELSSGIGLDNIRKRYELISGQGIEVSTTRDHFIVRIPVIIPS